MYLKLSIAAAYLMAFHLPVAAADLGFFVDDMNSCPNVAMSERRGTANTWSCADRPGWLRYILAGSTHPNGDANAFYVFRDFVAARYSVQFRVQYSLPAGTGRQLFFRVLLGGTAGKGVTEAVFWRNRDDASSSNHLVYATFIENGVTVAQTSLPTVANDQHWVRITRTWQSMTIERSSDGVTFAPMLTRTFQAPLGTLNTVMLSGASFASEGGHADYDWIRVDPQ